MVKLDKYQEQAMEMALDEDVTIMFIDGKAGTGKSFTALQIEKRLKREGWHVSKISPTGKAAKRIGGSTIHTWLEPDVKEDDWGNPKILGFNKTSLSDKEAVFIDEASMIDNKLWWEIQNVFKGTVFKLKKLIFVGDTFQLEPVGDGTPFLDNIKKTEFKVTLETIHRQKDDNDIVFFANCIREGVEFDDFYNNVKPTNREAAINGVLNDPDNSQILSPMKKGLNGVDNINSEIQDTLKKAGKLGDKVLETMEWYTKPDGKRGKRRKGDIFIGDKIVITRNRVDLKLTNGTSGIVTSTGMEEMTVWKFGMPLKKMVEVIYFEDSIDGEVLFVPSRWGQDAIDLAYSLTVHKFQGSEAKNIYFMVSADQTYYLDNKMYYTAATRASENLYLIT